MSSTVGIVVVVAAAAAGPAALESVSSRSLLLPFRVYLVNTFHTTWLHGREH